MFIVLSYMDLVSNYKYVLHSKHTATWCFVQQLGNSVAQSTQPKNRGMAAAIDSLSG